MEILDLLDDGVELLALGLVHDVGVVHPDQSAVRRSHRHVQLVDLGELCSLGVGGAGHPSELVVHPEVVLEGDRGEGLVLLLDPEPFLRFDRLVEPVRPAAARHQTAGELVDDDDLAVLGDVVHVLLEEGVGAQALVDVVERVDVLGVVEVADRKELLAAGDPGLGQGHRLRLLVDDEVALPDLLDLVELALGDRRRPGEPGDDPVDLVVEVGRLLGRPGDDQRGPRLVDQDRVDLVDDGVVELALDQLLEREAHVVAQVVEAELVVRPVRDVREVRLAPLARPEPRQAGVGRHVGRVVEERSLVLDDRDRQPELMKDRAHPLGVAPRQVVVDGDDVDAPAGEAVEDRGQGRDEGLALAGGHLRDLALVEHHAAHELDVEVAHAEPPAADLPHHREDFGEDLVEVGPFLELLPELVRAPPEGLLGPASDLGLQRVDGGHPGPHPLDIALVLGSEDLAEDEIDHDGPHCTPPKQAGPAESPISPALTSPAPE